MMTIRRRAVVVTAFFFLTVSGAIAQQNPAAQPKVKKISVSLRQANGELMELPKEEAVIMGDQRSSGPNTHGLGIEWIPGGKSKVRLHVGDPIEIIARLPGRIEPAQLDLVSYQTWGNQRRTGLNSLVLLGGGGIHRNFIPLNSELQPDGSWKFTPKEPLQVGEYCLTPNYSNDNFCFGVDLSVGQPVASPAIPDGSPAFREQSELLRLSDGSVSGTMYHNPELGFGYQFPDGWNVDDKATQAKAIASQQQFVWAEDSDPNAKGNGTPCSKELLTVTRYPVGMQVAGFNPLAVVIAADPACLPTMSFPYSVKDKNAIMAIASNLGVFFKAAATTSASPGRVRAFDMGGRVALQISEEFKIQSQRPQKSSSQSISASVLVLKADKYWIMMMFAAADAPDMAKLQQGKIFFDSASN